MTIGEAWIGRIAASALLCSSLALPALAQEQPANEPSAAEPAVTEACSNRAEVLRFETGSSELSGEARQALDHVATQLRENANEVVRVDGYADPVGTPDVNQQLSDQRAQAVGSYLGTKGVDADRVEVHGRGEPAQAPQPPTPDQGQRIATVTMCERKLAMAQPPPPEAQPPAAEPLPEPLPEPVAVSRSAQEGAVPRPLLGAGVGLTAGGGVVGFNDSGSNSIADTGGSWEVRLTLGTRLPLGLDFAYVGSAQNLNLAGVGTNAYLLGNGGEMDLRLQWPRGMFRPFVFGGVGWTHYSVQNGSVAGTALNGSDNVGTVPLGLGIAIGKLDGLMFELRAAERLTYDDDLFARTNVGGTSLDNWNVTARLGAEF